MVGAMTALDDWARTVTTALGIAPTDASDRELVLDLARDVAHGVMRPAAPLTSYLLGIAVGRGIDAATAAATIAELARAWPRDDSESAR
jgi:hypothetical protein